MYKIVRFYRNDKRPRKIKGGLSLEEAQSHCKSPKTKGKDWFDGYEQEKPKRKRQSRSIFGL